MYQVVVLAVLDGGHGFFECFFQHTAITRHVVQKLHHATCVRQLFCGRGPVGTAQQHGVAHNFAGFPAGVGVVADVDHTVGCQVFRCDAQDRRLHSRWHPAVHPVADDVVELPERGVHLLQVHVLQGDIAQPGAGNVLLPLLHLHGGQINTHGLQLGVTCGQRDQITSRRTPQLQHPRLRRRAGCQAEQVGNGLQVFRGGLRERM